MGFTGNPVAAAIDHFRFFENLKKVVIVTVNVAYGSMGDYLGLEEVIDRLLEITWGASSPDDDYQMQLLHVVQRVTVDEMMVQASSVDSSGEVKAVLADRLDKLENQIERRRNASAHQAAVAADIRRWQQRPVNAILGPALRMPPGDPI